MWSTVGVGRALMLVSVVGMVGGGAALASGLGGDRPGLSLAGGLVAAVAAPLLVSGLALSGHARVREGGHGRESGKPARATISRAWETGPWVNDKPAIGMELSVDAGEEVFPATVKERLPNFHLLVGLLQPGTELPVRIATGSKGRRVAVDWEAWDDERSRGARAALADPVPELPTVAPALGAHVVDGVRRPARRRRVAVAVVVVAVPLGAGVALWSGGSETAGLVLCMAGAFIASFVVSSIVVGSREGVTLAEVPERGWPGDRGVAEVLEVWSIGRLGYERVHGFVLRVHAGGRQWDVQLRQAVPEQWLRSLDRGLRVAVRASPEDEGRVAIDWEAPVPP
jgi:hypothetical protein